MMKKEKQKIEKIKEILQKNKLTNIKVCNFGIYYQYELAGQKVDIEVLDDINLKPNEVEVFVGKSEDDIKYKIKKITIEEVNELKNLLSFINKKYIYNTLNFDDEGQYSLILKNDGTFDYVNFKI